jgi:hypothetical protein
VRIILIIEFGWIRCVTVYLKLFWSSYQSIIKKK